MSEDWKFAMLKEIRDDLKEVKEKQNEANIELTKIKMQGEINKDNLEHHMRRTKASEDRIVLLEKWKWRTTGAVICLSFSIPYILKFFFS